MLYKAVKSFIGVRVSMAKDEVKNIEDTEIAKDLVDAGYIERINENLLPGEKFKEKLKKSPLKEGITYGKRNQDK